MNLDQWMRKRKHGRAMSSEQDLRKNSGVKKEGKNEKKKKKKKKIFKKKLKKIKNFWAVWCVEPIKRN